MEKGKGIVRIYSFVFVTCCGRGMGFVANLTIGYLL